MSNTDLLGGDVETKVNPPAGGAESADAAAAGEHTPQDANGTTPKRRAGGLSGMVIADLRTLANELGVGDTSGMRKGDLIAAIRERQGKSKRRAAGEDTLPLEGVATERSAPAQEQPAASRRSGNKPAEAKQAEAAPTEGKPADSTSAGNAPADSAPVESKQADTKQADTKQAERKQGERKQGENQQSQGENQQGQQGGDDSGRSRRRRGGSGRQGGNADAGGNQRGEDKDTSGDQQRGGGDQRRPNDRQQNNQNQRNQGQQGNRGQDNRGGQDDDDDERGGRRGRRFRDRRRRGGRGEGGGSPDTEIREDDVLLPVAGILDVLDNYAFVRTSGYLAGPNDVYVSLSLVRKFGLRRGDAITGAVRQPRDGEQQRQKFNPLVRVDTINGLDPDSAKKRPEFTKLTPLYPNERLRLETESNRLTTRVIDLVMPVGKGQRALIVSPPKAGKTTIMQDIANAITTNNPECHLMVVLVDERPEEVTDMQRSVQGEVIASTFDRPPSDHTSAAELSIERAKRLVEMGHDVVVLLDSITRLGRAYNLAAPASGRILSGGVDSTALFPPKRFLGAARNIENGGSLTIFATAMVETGSTGDTVIFEEFKGTGNAELKLDRKIAERRVFPAVDVNPSGTRKEELLLAPDELAVTHKLHRVLHALDSQQAIDLLLDRLRKTKTNTEFLMQVSKTAPGQDDD
ncbi:transcription termination factor Rho [Amycolatopsis palatopharyngis]|uniref:transcription termination factor Rho n=1 Tax=Amycolatopsis palatopharyngis TaxID=187982 RepID=UPI000E239B29|nr:transcription termination factor Rho [Amycolatopsis palatopharyngis]